MDRIDYLKLKKLIEPCLTPEELDEYIQKNFNAHLPWDVVDENSTSAPLIFVWEVYQTLLCNEGNLRHVLASSRNAAKTLTSSMLQYFAMIHFRRDGAHIAATLNQSSQAVNYLNDFMNNPLLAGYQTSNNTRKRHYNGLPPNDFTARTNAALQVVTASKKGANAPRASFLTFDEVDLTPPEILSEAAYIGDPAEVVSPVTGKKIYYDAISIYLSSRKTNNGPIQELIDEAVVTDSGQEIVGSVNLKPKLHMWSSVDWMQRCPPEIHKPAQGTFPVYVDTESLKTVWSKEEFEEFVPSSNKEKYKEYQAFEGCRNCPAWIPCFGRSVKQRGTSPALRSRSFTASILKSVKDPAAIIAQSLNWKPETTGIVFKSFVRYKHLKPPMDFYEFVTNGIRFDPDGVGDDELARIYAEGTPKEIKRITPSKEDTYDAMQEHGWTIIGGLDWGYDPDPAVGEIVGWHKKWKKCVILHIEAETGYANHVWADYFAANIHERFPCDFVAPDQADPSSITYFAKHRIPSLGKKDKPAKIITGVSFLRGLLWDPSKNEANFAIFDDSETEDKNYMLVQAMEHWTHAKDALGRYIMDKFADDDNTHAIDPIRYALHPFTTARGFTRATDQKTERLSNRELANNVANGDLNSKKILEEKSKIENTMKEYFRTEHGLENVFKDKDKKPPKQIRTQEELAQEEKKEKNKKGKQSGGIKFSI